MNTGDSRELSVGGQAPSVDSRADAASELGPKNSKIPSEDSACETSCEESPLDFEIPLIAQGTVNAIAVRAVLPSVVEWDE